MTALTIARRTAAVALLASALAACNNNTAKGPAVASSGDDMAIGSPNAPVKVVEYASPTCPHCAKYEKEDFPALKSKYIDTGKVYYVFHETPIHPQYDVPAFLLLRCLPKDKYFDGVKAVMDGQSEYFSPAITGGPNADAQVGEAFRTVLLRIAKDQGGMDETKAMACMTDESASDKLQARTKADMDQNEVHSTPTFIVNGVKVVQPDTVEMSNALVFPAIDQALAKKS
jgi:protein-disulfide isomerase